MKVAIASVYLKGAKFEFMLHDDFEDAINPLRPLITLLRDKHKLFSAWSIGPIDSECKFWVVYKKSKRAGCVRFKFSEIPHTEPEAAEFFAVLQVKAIAEAWDF